MDIVGLFFNLKKNCCSGYLLSQVGVMIASPLTALSTYCITSNSKDRTLMINQIQITLYTIK